MTSDKGVMATGARVLTALLFLCGPVTAADSPQTPPPCAPEHRARIDRLLDVPVEELPRKRAFQELARGGDTVVDQLCALAREGTTEACGERTQTTVCRVLGTLGNPKATLPLMLVMLDAGSSFEGRHAAIDALTRIGDRRAIVDLVRVLRGSETQLRRPAARALVSFAEEPRARRGLLSSARHPEATVRAASVEAIGDLEPETALRPLLQATRDTDAGVRAAAVRALARLGVAQGQTGIVHVLRDTDFGARLAAVESLAPFGAAAGSETGWLLERLADPEEDEILRTAAANTLGHVGSGNLKVGLALLDAMAEAEPLLREGILSGLLAMRVRELVGLAIERLQEAKPATRTAIERVLSAWSGREPDPKETWADWWTKVEDTFVFPAPDRER